MGSTLSRLGLALVLLLGLSTSAVEGEHALEARISDAFRAGRLPGLHAVLVLRDNKTVAEVYFAGDDKRSGEKLGWHERGPRTLHDVQSISKSVVSLLYGIALEEGLVPGLDESLVAQFPEYADLMQDPKRRAILVRHALTMTMGTDWHQESPFTDPNDSVYQMEAAPDPYRFVLDLPMVYQPGEHWAYSNGATEVIAKLIADRVGMPIDEYARENLFAPLGITEWEWVRGRRGAPAAASGLRLTARGLAKFGELILGRGEFKGRRIVSADWLEASFKPRLTLDENQRYGFFWWLSGEGKSPAWVAGFGNGGQRLSVHPALKLTTVVFAGNYDQPDAWRLPFKVLEEFVLPALESGRTAN